MIILRKLRSTALIFLAILSTTRSWATGTWTALTHSAPNTVQLMLLLPDGTVMAGDGGGNTWQRLTPDSNGSYVNGTWSTLASMNDTRLYFSSQVLVDGRVFVAGGEYGSGTNRAEVYDPVNDFWTMAPAPPTGQTRFFDSCSEILPNGKLLISPVSPATSGGTVLYDPVLNKFTAGPKLFRGSYQDEASWVKLADGSILTIDPFGTNSERYIPSRNQWLNDANVPVKLYDPYGSEMGPGFLLPNGQVIMFGATTNNAIYTPSGSTVAGTWATAAGFPNGQGMPDSSGAMMVNGKILLATSPTPTSANHFPTPTSYYEYDYTSNAFTRINGPTGSLTRSISTYITTMLDLPDGTVLYSEFGNHLYVYKPDGTPLTNGTPNILSLTTNSDSTYHLVGTLFNGISEGAAYGDDNQMSGNRPIVRMTNITSHSVYYCRTFNWSSVGVMTGTNNVTTEFAVPASVPYGNYSLVVSANGNSSAPTNFVYYPPLVITSTPASQTNLIGTDINFSVSASGYGTLSYQWQFNGTNLVDNAHVSGSQSSFLVISSAGLTDAGSYQVVVTDNNGSITSVAANLVITLPADAVPQFTGISLVGGFPGGYPQMTITGHPGGNYEIDVSTNLVDWMPLTNFNNASGTYIFSDTSVMPGEKIFYRAKYIP